MNLSRKHVGPRMSQITIAGELVFLAGQVADEPKGRSCADQARQILAKMDRYLEEAGSTKAKLVQVTVYLTDMKYFAEFNSVWDAWVQPGHTPPRACVQANLAGPDWLVEVVAIAAR